MSLEDTPVKGNAQSAPQGYALKAEREAAKILQEVKDLLHQQAELEQKGGVESTELEPESSMIFGASNSPQELQALPKVGTVSIAVRM